MSFVFLNSTFTSQVTISYVLQSFFGLGKRNVFKIISRYGIKPGYRVSTIPISVLSDIEKYIFYNFRFGRSYQRSYLQFKNFKLRSGLYSGIRIARGLPSRGQRSKTNAATSKRLNAKLSF